MNVPVGMTGPLVCVSLKVGVSEVLCKGCGLCRQRCSRLFEVAGGVARVTVETVPAELEDACFDALEDCPNGAISVYEVRSQPVGLVTA
jgi:ferredoxin